MRNDHLLLLVSCGLIAAASGVSSQPAAPTGIPEIVRSFDATDGSPTSIDESLAAGPTSLILANNGSIALRSKAGTLLTSAALGLFFKSVLEPTAFPFDVRVLFDEGSSRFLILAAGRERIVRTGCPGTPGACLSHFYLAVSKSQSPSTLTTSDWHLFALDATMDNREPTERWADFPSLGISDNAVVITAQMFPFDATATGSNKVLKIRVLDKAKLLVGVPSGWTDFIAPQDPSGGGALRAALQPVHQFGRAQATFVVGKAVTSNCGFVVFGIDGGDPPTLTSRTAASVPPDCPGQAPDAPQPGDVAPLAVNGGLRVPAVYRNGSLWIAEAVGRAYGSTTVSAIRVSQLNVENWPDPPVIVQQAYLATENVWRYYPALTVDDANNVGLVFGQSSRIEAAALYVSGRLATDPLNTLREPVLFKRGEAALTLPTNSRGAISFGDYFGAAIDPIEDTVWVIGEYAATSNAIRRFAGELRLGTAGASRRRR